MGETFRNNKEYERQEAYSEKMRRRMANTITDGFYNHALDLIEEIDEHLEDLGEYMTDFDRAEIKNLRDQIDNAISEEVREFIGRG